MSPFEIQVHCYVLKTPSSEHHHLESPINILSSLPTDPAPSHIITRARGETHDNHVSYIPISSLVVTQPFERRSYCHGIVQSDCPWPNEKGDKVWLRSDIPLLVGHRGVPVYNITKGACCEVWIDNVDWRWDKQSILTPVSLSNQRTAPTRSTNKARTLVLAGPARASVVGLNRHAAELVQMAIVSERVSYTRSTQGEKVQNQVWNPFHHVQSIHQTRRQICCFIARELEEQWVNTAGKRSSPLAASSSNGNDTAVVKKKGVLKTSSM